MTNQIFRGRPVTICYTCGGKRYASTCKCHKIQNNRQQYRKKGQGKWIYQTEDHVSRLTLEKD